MIVRAQQLPAETYDRVPRIEHLPVMTGVTLSVLPASVEEKLSRPHFAIHRPASFGKQGNVPLPYGNACGCLYCRYNKASVTATCANAPFALHRFAAANHPDVVHPIMWQPGDMLIVKNPPILPARDGSPLLRQTDRWMLRVCGVNDPARVVPLGPHQPFIVRA